MLPYTQFSSSVRVWEILTTIIIIIIIMQVSPCFIQSDCYCYLVQICLKLLMFIVTGLMLVNRQMHNTTCTCTCTHVTCTCTHVTHCTISIFLNIQSHDGILGVVMEVGVVSPLVWVWFHYRHVISIGCGIVPLHNKLCRPFKENATFEFYSRT